MTKIPPYSPDQLRQMAGEPMASASTISVIEQIAWITEALAERTEDKHAPTALREQPVGAEADAAPDDFAAQFAKQRDEYERRLAEISLRAELAEKQRDNLLAQLRSAKEDRDQAAAALLAEREHSQDYERQIADVSAGAEQAQKDRDELLAKVEALAKELDEVKAALLTGEKDPETGHPVTWEEKADQWSFAFIMAKRRAERAESERDALAGRVKELESLEAEKKPVSSSVRRVWLAQAG